MDLISHVLLSYIFAYWVFGLQTKYLIAASIAGALPDMDVLLWPISRKFKLLRHHGITHSIVGVLLITAVMAPVFLWNFGGNLYVYALIFAFGGLGHILLDSSTQFKVSPLLPFKQNSLRFDADRAVNILVLVLSLGAMIVLLLEMNNVPLYYFTITMYFVTLLYLVYALLRIIGRYKVKKYYISHHMNGEILATANPLNWLIFGRKLHRRSITLNLFKYNALNAKCKKLINTQLSNIKPVRIKTLSQAIALSYSKIKGDWLISSTRCVFKAARKGSLWSIVWYSLDLAGMGYSAAIYTTINREGRISVKSGWYKIKELGVIF